MVRRPAIAGPRRYASVNADWGMQCIPAPHVVRAELRAVVLAAVLPARGRARRRCSAERERATTQSLSGAHTSSAPVGAADRAGTRCRASRTPEGARRWRSTGLDTHRLFAQRSDRGTIVGPASQELSPIGSSTPYGPTRWVTLRVPHLLRDVPFVRAARTPGDPGDNVEMAKVMPRAHSRLGQSSTSPVPCAASRAGSLRSTDRQREATTLSVVWTLETAAAVPMCGLCCARVQTRRGGRNQRASHPSLVLASSSSSNTAFNVSNNFGIVVALFGDN